VAGFWLLVVAKPSRAVVKGFLAVMLTGFLGAVVGYYLEAGLEYFLEILFAGFTGAAVDADLAPLGLANCFASSHVNANIVIYRTPLLV
jgi:hypothetical protein